MNRRNYQKEVEIINRRYEEKYFPKVLKTLQSRVDEVKNVVSERGVEGAMNHVMQMVGNVALSDTVSGLYREVGLRFARRQWIEFNKQKRKSLFQTKGFGFNATWTEFIKNYLFKFLLEKLTYEVDETTRKELLKILTLSIQQGWGVDRTVRELDETKFTRVQAARIVRSEITRASNTGTMAAGETFEFEQVKEWISAHDGRTRGGPAHPKDHANHWDLDGTVIDFEDFFIDKRNGDKLRFPGDPNASVASTINCRCTIAVYGKRDSNGELIPKRKTTTVIYPNQNIRRTIITV